MATALLPDGLLQFRLQVGVVRLMSAVFDSHSSKATPVHVEKCFGDVVDLRFGHDDDRVVTESGVRTEKEEEIRKIRHSQASKRLT